MCDVARVSCFHKVVPFISFICEYLQAVALCYARPNAEPTNHLHLFSHRFQLPILHPPQLRRSRSNLLHTSIDHWGGCSPLWLLHSTRKVERWSKDLGPEISHLKVTRSPWRMVFKIGFLSLSWNKKICQISRTWKFSSASCGCSCLAGKPNIKCQRGTFFQPPGCF